MRTFRLKQMEQYVLENGTVTMDDLCSRFGVSINTVRHDVSNLVEKGSVKKIYGGVCSNQSNSFLPFDEKRRQNISRKQCIGQTAAGFVEDGDVVFIDSGTTTMHIVEHIDPAKRVTILTNNLHAINAALGYDNLEVISLPGRLERRNNAFVAADTVKLLAKYNIRRSFMATTGISQNGGVTSASQLEYEIKKTTIAQSDKVFLLADSSKFGKPSLITYASIDDMHYVITDDEADEHFLALCSQREVPVKIAK